MSKTRVSRETLFTYTVPTLVFHLAFVLALGFLVMILSLLIGIHASETLLHTNPFADYETLWPGQPATNIVAYALTAAKGEMTCMSPVPLESDFANSILGQAAFCTNTSQEGLFRTMKVSVYEGQVQELRLFSDNLHQDDLFLYWGAPDAIRRTGNPSHLDLYWERSTYTMIASVDVLGSVVEVVTLTAKE